MANSNYRSRSWIVLPDCQVKPGVNTDHLEHAGKYIADKRPDVLVNLGDFGDMPSLSSYDRGKKSFEGRRYKADIEAVRAGMARLMQPIKDLNKKLAASKEALYKPRMVLTLGNHEERILRAIEDDAKLDGTIGISDLGYEEAGWEVYEFLQPVEIDGILLSHYFPRSASGAVTQTKNGAPNARTQLQREGGSCIAGHRQGLEVWCQPLRGKMQWGIIAGSFYSHNEQYLSAQGNLHWRGIIVLHEVSNGSFDPTFVSINYLKRRYGSPTKKA